MYVAASAEVLALAREQHRTNAGLAMADHDCVAQRLEKLYIHAVGDIGPIEGDMGNAVCNTQQNRSLINHRQAHVSSVIPPAELT